MAKVKVVEAFVDVSENKTRRLDEIIECDASRAKHLVGTGYCVLVEPKKSAKKAAKEKVSE